MLSTMCGEENHEYFKNSIVQPPCFKTNLYPHQLTAISMLEEREEKKKLVESRPCEINSDQKYEINSTVGIYAEITGYGKTNTIIGLIIRDKMEWDTNTLYTHKTYITHYGEGRILATENVQYEKINCNLVLMGPSLIKQWENELAATSLKYISLTTRKQISTCNPQNYDVILITHTMYNLFVGQFMNKKPYPFAWKRFIFDEPQSTNISAMKSIMAGFNWFITATPTQLLNKSRNRNSFITNLFHLYMHRNIFDELIVKNDDDYVRQSYSLPETFHNYYKCYQPLYNIIKGIASESVTNMIAGGNIAGAIRLLNGSTTSDKDILDLLKKRKTEELAEIEFKINKYIERSDKEKELKWCEKKQFIETQLKNLSERIKTTFAGTCVICTQTYQKPVMISGCCHLFCGECVLEWLKSKPTCPTCRYNIAPQDLIYLDSNDSNELGDKKEELLTKPQIISNIINGKPDGKFIIFSSFDETFNLIRHSLDNDNVMYAEISGKREKREQLLDNYRTGNIKVLFLNSTNNGAGINLQETTDIILYHKMNDEQQTQILGRANRIGRKINLSVHHLN